MTPRACAKWSAWHTLAKAVRSLRRVNCRAAFASASRRAAKISSKVAPRSRFIVKYTWPSASRARSYTGTIAGCSSCPCTHASRRNRATRSARAACSARIVLSATSRPMRWSRHAWTTPMPPSPSLSAIV